jgi:hypothetical protein
MDKNKGLAVDLVLVGQLDNFNLATARNQFPNDPGYRVELLLERGSAAALRDLRKVLSVTPLMSNFPSSAARPPSPQNSSPL